MSLINDDRISTPVYMDIISGHVSSRLEKPVDTDYKRLIPLSKVLAKPISIDYTSPLIHDGEYREDVEYDLEANFGWKFANLDSNLQDLERNERLKIGPISIKMDFSLRYESIHEYFSSNNFSPRPDVFVRSVNSVVDLVPSNRLRPVSVDKVYEKSDKTTNWGAPTATSGTDSGAIHLELAKDIIKDPFVPSLYSILGWRGQSSGNEVPKQRDVWMYPHSIVLVELTFLHALLPLLKELDCFCMLKSVDSASIPITRMINKAQNTSNAVIGFDATAFDKNCSKELIYAAFYVLKRWFQPWCHDLIDVICIYFCTSGIIANGQLLTGRKGGVPSGSGLTNLIDSIIHLILFNYVNILEGDLDDSECTVMGDDGVWFLRGLTPHRLSEILLDLGHEVNPIKVSYSTEYVTFCQRIFLNSTRKQGICYGIRSIYRTLNSMMSYERKPKFAGSYDSCRWITQLEECKHHPCFKDFVKFVIGRDENFSLGLYSENGPIDLFRDVGFENFMNYRGKGFLYTSQVRRESDIPNLVTARYIVELSSNGYAL